MQDKPAALVTGASKGRRDRAAIVTNICAACRSHAAQPRTALELLSIPRAK